MAALVVPPWTCATLRALATGLHRIADGLERRAARSLPLQPVRIVLQADDAIDERRHQIFTRYY
jgi:hypothetical protein